MCRFLSLLVWLEDVIHTRKMEFLENLTPKWGSVTTAPPKGTSLYGNALHVAKIVKIGRTVVDLSLIHI